VSRCGNLDDHCCYFSGEICQFLRDDGPNVGRRWVCTLREEHGSWDGVYADPRYQPVRERMLLLSTAPALCGDWPPTGKTCNTCGEIGTPVEVR